MLKNNVLKAKELMKNLQQKSAMPWRGISWILPLFALFALISANAAPPEHGGNPKNPYDSKLLTVNEIITTYHENVNDAFNNYIALMLSAQAENAKNPGASDDPNGKPLKSAAECLDPANNRNYSTFCLSINLLGGNNDECDQPDEKKTDDFKKFCQLGGGARPLKGYLNFKAALQKKKKSIFDTEKDQNKWQTLGKNTLDSATVIRKIFTRNTDVDKEIDIAKKALDQTLSAYDQLRLAWPMHVRYQQIYKDLKTYRDKLVDIRQQVDLFPSKFIDLTTTKCF